MDKYGVLREDSLCDDCGGKMLKIDGKEVCLDCEASARFSTPKVVKRAKCLETKPKGKSER